MRTAAGLAFLAIAAAFPHASAVAQQAGASPAADYRPAAISRFVAPAGPMLLSRTLRRPMPDGAEFTVTRSYRIQFVAEATGFRIDGDLVAVTVKAPDELAAFADLERARPDTGMFPLHLDAAGMLRPGAATASGEEVRKAAEIVLERMGQNQMATLDVIEAQSFLQRIRQRPAASKWPADVFRPQATALSKTSEMPLPGGAAGRISIETTARLQGSDGLMREMARTVITDLGGDIRHTYEIWSLEPMPR